MASGVNMANHKDKLYNFEEYDAAKAEREGTEEVEKRVEGTLDSIVLNAVRRGKRELKGIGFGAIVRNPLGALDVIIHGPGEFVRMYIKANKPQFQHGAELLAYRELFQENIRDLIRCAVRLSNENKGYLAPEHQQELFVRLVDEFELLAGRPHFKNLHDDVQDLSYVQRRLHLPDDEEGLRKMRNVLHGMRREGYLTHQNAETLYRLLTQKMPVQEEGPALHAHHVPNSPEAAFHYARGKPEDATADYVRAEKEKEISHFAHELELLIGGENAAALIKKLNVDAYYGEGLLTKYLTTVQKIEERLRKGNGNLRNNYGIEHHPWRYGSLDELLKLKRELYEEAGSYTPAGAAEVADGVPAPAIDISKLNLPQYHTLHRGDSAAERRLQSLVESGEVQVGRSEHWYGRSEKGARGKNILKRIGYDLERIFSELGLPRPKFRYNFGQNTIRIPEETRQLLGQIRDEAYKVQKERTK